MLDRLTLNFGVRFDRSRLLTPASQWSPRIGAAYELRDGTTLRGSYMRLYQPPQAEYLLLASSPEARALSPFVDEAGGGAAIPPERQHAFDLSIAPALVGGVTREGVSGYAIQPGKVQPPPLREETLARHRLLDWLDVKIHNRLVFVIADAGYGKTTLLADFGRRTRLRTLWYRMDGEDRNWVAFLPPRGRPCP